MTKTEVLVFESVINPHVLLFCLLTNTRKVRLKKKDILSSEELKFGHSDFRRIEISDILIFEELKTRPR